jgi:2-polyprenyl-6-methoxyphenol hydroxylase-like FAD-dependent oxidoreductase
MATQSTTNSHPLAGKHIIVAGGGLAGLTFVRALSRYWPQDVQRPRISLYERDPRILPSERGNYSLGLRADKFSGGLQALKKVGLIDEMFALRTAGSDLGVIIRDANWNVMTSRKTESTPDGLPAWHMRVTRYNIRECLIQGAPEEVEMHFDVGCTSAAQNKTGGMEVMLSDGSTTECDLLIVADGANSRLRRSLRPDDGLDYAGAVMIGGNAQFPEGKVPSQLTEGIGPLIGGDGHGLVVFPITDTNYIWYVTRRSPTPREEMRGTSDKELQDALIKEALEEGKIFAEPFPTMVAHTDRKSLKVLSARDKKPISHPQPTLPYIFIGDANHAISPFGGNGANFALMDGVSLAESICKSETMEVAVKMFDTECIPRCNTTLKTSKFTIWIAHTSGFAFWLAKLFFIILGWLTSG